MKKKRTIMDEVLSNKNIKFCECQGIGQPSLQMYVTPPFFEPTKIVRWFEHTKQSNMNPRANSWTKASRWMALNWKTWRWKDLRNVSRCRRWEGDDDLIIQRLLHGFVWYTFWFLFTIHEGRFGFRINMHIIFFNLIYLLDTHIYIYYTFFDSHIWAS